MPLVLYGIPVAVLIALLVQTAKDSFALTTRYATPLALAFGIIFALAAKFTDPAAGTWLEVIMLGLLTGFSASGLYSGQKALRE